MNDKLADTHSLIWFLVDPDRLSEAADSSLTAASLSGNIFISAITLVEVDYLSTKRSFPYLEVLSQIMLMVADPAENLAVLPLTHDVARAMARVPRAEIPDMPDRIIATTAVAHLLPLVSADAKIRGSASLRSIVPVIW